jgi:hypothetical protein
MQSNRMHRTTAEGSTMDRQATFLWMQDLLERLADSHRQWEAAGPRCDRYMAETMCRDLDELRRLCHWLPAERSVNDRTLVAA